MGEELKNRLSAELTKIFEDIDKYHIRKIQGDVHRCIASCYDNENDSSYVVTNCVDKCTTPVLRIQSYMGQELERIQDRLNRCVLDCNDKIQDRMGLSPSETKDDKLTQEFENCANSCANKFFEMIPSLESNLINFVKREKFDKLGQDSNFRI